MPPRHALTSPRALVLAALLTAGFPAATAFGQAGFVNPLAPLQQKVLSGLKLDRARLVGVSARVIPAGVDAAAERATLEVDLGAGTPTPFALEPYAVRSADFKLTVVGDDGVSAEIPAPPPSTYHGTSAAGDEAWASIIDGRVHAVIVTAADPHDPLYVQPVAEVVPGAPTALHAVYARSDVTPAAHSCGVDDCAECQAHHAPAGGVMLRGPGACRVAEIQMDCDYPFFQMNGSSAAQTAQDMDVVMLGVNQIYSTTAGFLPPVRLVVKACTVRVTAGADPYNSNPLVDANPDTMLTQMRTAWPNVSGRDITHLLTGRDLSGATIGYATMAAVCSNSNVGLSQSRWTTNLAGRYAVTAHELGHNWGMNHDSVNGFIMAPSVDASAPATLFSPQSIAAYNAAIGGFACTANAYPDVQPDWAVTLPGRQVFIDVLANDGRTVLACPTAVTSFTLPSTTTALGGTVAISAGTGPGGRDRVRYTPSAGTAGGATDTFTYTAAGVNVLGTVGVLTPRAPDGTVGSSPGLASLYYDIRNGSSVTLFPEPPDLSAYPARPGPASVAQLNYPPTSGNAVGSSANFGVGASFTGYVNVPAQDFWTFYITADDVARLTVGGQVLALETTTQAAGEASGTVALAPGLHPIKVDYCQYANTSTLVLSWSSSTQAKAVVPAAALFRVASTPSCPADYNNANGIDLLDIFAFLSDWFAGNPNADFNHMNGVDLLDIFAFLTAWFAGGC